MLVLKKAVMWMNAFFLGVQKATVDKLSLLCG